MKTDLELLRMVSMYNKTFQEMSAMEFYNYLTRKVNGVIGFNQDRNRIILSIQNPVMGKLADQSKLELLRCLERMNVTL